MAVKDRLQSNIQKAKNERQQQQAASSSAAKTWSTTTPTVTQTPKITSTPKAVQSQPNTQQQIQTTQQTIQPTINLFNPVSQVKQAQQIKEAAQQNGIIQEKTKEPNLFQKISQSSEQAKYKISDWINEKTSLFDISDLTVDSVKSWKTSVKTLLSIWWQDLLYSIASYWTQLDKWLTEEALYRTKQIAPKLYNKLYTADIVPDAYKMFDDIQNYLDTQTKWWKRMQELQGANITLQDALSHWDINTAFTLITNQFGNMIPIIAWWMLWWWLWAFWMALPTMAQESLDEFENDESLAWISEDAKRNAALWAWALKSAIESLDTMFEFFWLWKAVPVKQWVLSAFIKHKVATMFSEAWEEMAQYEIDELVAKLLGSERDWTSFTDLVKNVWFEAALYSLFFPTWTSLAIRQKWINKAYEELEAKIKEDMPEATKEQVELIAEEIMKNAAEDIRKWVVTDTEEDLDTAEEELSNLQDEQQELISQIEKETDDTKLEELSNKLIETNTKIEELNNKVEEMQWLLEKEEFPAEKPTTQIERDEWKNLSEQTMSQKDIEKIWKTDFNPYHDKDKAVKLYKKWNKMSTEKAAVDVTKYNLESLVNMKYMVQSLIRNWWNSDLSLEEAQDVMNKINKWILLRRDTLDKIYEESEIQWSKVKEMTFEEFYNKYKNKYATDSTLTTEKERLEEALRDYIFQLLDSELDSHLEWMSKWHIKDMMNNLTDEQIRSIQEMFAMISSVLKIDFNLVVEEWKKLWLNITTENIPSWSDTLKWLAIWEDLEDKLLEVWVVLTLKDWEASAASTLAHELWHIIDFSYIFNLDTQSPTYIETKRKWNKLIKTKKYNSILWRYWKLNPKWATYKYDKLLKDDKQLVKDYWLKKDAYWDKPTEVFARYVQQYVAYMTDQYLFDEMAEWDAYEKLPNWNIKIKENSRFWSREEFEKLLPEFRNIMENQLADYRMSDSNVLYYDAVKTINKYKEARLEMKTKEEKIKSLKEKYPNQTDAIVNKISELEDQYLRALSALEQLWWISAKLEWKIWEDIKEQYQWLMIELDSLESNFDLLMQEKDKYVEMQRETRDQQIQQELVDNTISDNTEEIIDEWNDIEENWEIEWWATEEIDNIAKSDDPIEEKPKKVVKAIEKSADKLIKSKKKKEAIKRVWTWLANAFKPALSRLYNIAPRLAWAVHTYEARRELLTLWYKKMTLDFAKELHTLKKKKPEQYKKLSLALMDWWMNPDIDIKEALRESGIDEKLFEPVVTVLNNIATSYKEAWLDITINDKYFPRKVKDYGLLLDYLSRKAGKDIKWTKSDLLTYIEDINNDDTLTPWQKEQKIHSKLINEFTKPSERSNNAKERKLVLSEWQLTEEEKKKWYVNDIIDFYEDPIVALSTYIDDMVKKTELKKMLWWLAEWWTAISENFDDSVANILQQMVDEWQISQDDVEVARHVIKSIVGAKPSNNIISGIKNATYSLTIANYISAAQQLEDMSKTLLKWPTWLKNIAKTILWKAWIKMSDTWLENAFAQLEWWNVTDALFKLSWFDMVDWLWKKSFLMTAYDSCVRRANWKRAIILETRLKSMYGEKKGQEMFDKYKNKQLKNDKWQFDIDLMIDLMYQLWSTQPIYKSAMPTAYLNNSTIRLAYCLCSFTIKQLDWLEQWTREVYKNQLIMWKSKATAASVATWWLVGNLIVITLISTLVTDLLSTIKWDEEDTALYKLLNEWLWEALKQLWVNGIAWLLKIFNISRYDSYLWKREWLMWVLMNKVTPASFSIFNDFIKIAVWDEELTDLWRYWPLFIKPLYYIFRNNEIAPEVMEYKLWWWSTKWVKPQFWNSWWGWWATKPQFWKY